MTVLELITASMHRLGFLEATEVPRAEDVDAVKTAANAWIDALALDDLFLYRIERHVFNLVANTASYSIGVGGTFDVPRPVAIERCGVIVDPAAGTPREVPLGPPLEVAEWALVRTKTFTSAYPERVFYDPDAAGGLGRVYVHPVPTTSTPDLVLYIPEPLTELGLNDAALDLPAGYRRLLITNIAVEAADILGAAPTPELVAQAQQAVIAVQRANLRAEVLDIPLSVPGMAVGRRYDIELG